MKHNRDGEFYVYFQFNNDCWLIVFFVSKAKSLSKAINALEKFNKEKYPPCVKHLLVESGFNTLMALEKIGDAELAKIEEHINMRPELLNDLQCCYSNIYRSQNVFQFLPGHKSMILSMKNQIQQLKEYREKNSPRRAKQARSADELKGALLKSLQDFLGKHKQRKDLITERNIIDFEEQVKGSRKTYRCVFACFLCKKKVPIMYNTFWMHSNATKHIRDEHLNKSDGSESVEYIEVIEEEMAENLEIEILEDNE